MSNDEAGFIRRDVWGSRSDKVWWFVSVLVYGAPCLALLLGGTLARSVSTVVVASVLLVGFAIFNWRIRASENGLLLVEVTSEGIRLGEGRPMLPWTAVAWVGYARVNGFGTVAPSLALVLHLVDGGAVHRVFDGVRIEGIHQDVREAIRRYAPQIPISDDDTPPPLPRTDPPPTGDLSGSGTEAPGLG